MNTKDEIKQLKDKQRKLNKQTHQKWLDMFQMKNGTKKTLFWTGIGLVILGLVMIFITIIVSASIGGIDFDGFFIPIIVGAGSIILSAVFFGCVWFADKTKSKNTSKSKDIDNGDEE